MIDTDEILERPYHWVFRPCFEGGELHYHGTVLEFPGCETVGDSAEDVMLSLMSVAEGWLLACHQFGHEIPEPFDGLNREAGFRFEVIEGGKPH